MNYVGVTPQQTELYNKVINNDPSIAGFNSSYAGTNPIYFDTLGLATRVGFRLSF
ncbi:MAG TPA: hypothetical protein VGM84_24300 [Steroidobacteraceae bacterium]